jgi:hypothetical protein
MITLGPSLTGLRGTQVTGSIIYTLVSDIYNVRDLIVSITIPSSILLPTLLLYSFP